MFPIGKLTISYGHGFNSYVSHSQRVMLTFLHLFVNIVTKLSLFKLTYFTATDLNRVKIVVHQLTRSPWKTPQQKWGPRGLWLCLSCLRELLNPVVFSCFFHHFGLGKPSFWCWISGPSTVSFIISIGVQIGDMFFVVFHVHMV